MPSVNLSPETYAKLEARARTQHATPDSIAEAVVRAHIDDAPTWADHWASIEAKPSEALTEEEVNFEVDRATDEVRAKRYARTLSEEQLVSEWQRALAEVRTNLPPGLSEAEVDAEVDAALAEVRAERDSRGR